MYNETNHSERQHATYSPSKLKALEICPRFQQDNDAPPHPITLRGTAMHEAVEAGTPEIEGLSDYEKEMVRYCLDFQAEWSMDPTWVSFPEMKLTTPGGNFGYCDQLYIRGKEAILLDWKFSTRVQTAVEDNVAAQAYSWGILNDWPDIVDVTVYYVYPRLDLVSTHRFTRNDMDRIELRVETIIARAKANLEDQEMPTEEGCLYCSRKATCSALHKLALPIHNEYKKDELTIIPEYHASQISDPTVMSKAMALATIMGEWADSVKFHANKMRRETGQEIPGYIWANREGGLAVVDTEKVISLALESGLTKDEIMQTVTVSIPKLSEALSEKAPKGEKTKAAARFKRVVEDAEAVIRQPDTQFLRRERKTKY
jgi:hypothetical protein